MQKLYGIIGYPLEHSFSKKYFTDKFAQLNLTDCVYQTFPLQHIADFPSLLTQQKNLCGLNVTIPYKKDVLTYLDDVTNIPTNLGACNCIKFSNGKLIGFNTDYIGFKKSLQPLLKPQHHTKALVLGNGGAANAVKYALQQLNILYNVVGRKKEDGIIFLYDDLSKEIISEHTIIINTTPLGTFPNVKDCPNIPYEFITPKHLLYDLIYNPQETLFLQKGKQQGATTKNGYEMLILQAEENWRIWNS